MPSRAERIDAAVAAESESSFVDFKERFDLKSARDWCEIVKDVIAMANSGGGSLVFGVRDDGTPSSWDPKPILSLDPARVTDKISKYTTRQFAEFEIVAASRGGEAVAVLLVNEVRVPIVFSKPGTYSVGGGRQKSAFAQGTVYFRHGAKSEPGTTEDLASVVDRRLSEERDHLLANVRKVFQAPPGHGVVLVAGRTVIDPEAPTASMRLTSNPDAPEFRPVSPDAVYPFRQKEVIEEVNRRLGGRCKINQFDVLCVRRVHRIDHTKPQFVEHRKFGSPQYTMKFVEWILEQYEADLEFFEKARSAFRTRQSVKNRPARVRE